ncbi:MAG: hypothetical protein ABIH40_03795 [Candidatus Omnitrophota bacterium]
MKPKLIISIILILLPVLIPAAVFSNEEKPVEILLFTSVRCRACQKVKEGIIPRVEKKYGDKIKIKELDFDQPDNYIKLLELQDKYGWHPKENLNPTLIIEGKFLVGSNEIENYLEMHIDTALSERGYALVAAARPSADLLKRFEFFSPLTVFAAGLIDGINPCAFTAIIFFISFLTLQGYDKRQILAIGLSFIAAVFVTYVLIGLGAFNVLFRLKGYPVAVNLLYLGGAVLCFILAGFAVYDFAKFRRNHQTQGLVLQLPESLKNRIRRIIGLHYRKTEDKDTIRMPISRLIFSAFVVGFMVSLFEAVCTGQVYLPTIVYVLKYTHMKPEAFFYLLVYNLMFIFPLWVIMLFALWGVTSQQFGRFAQKHMGSIKILMAILFLGLGFFLILS